MPNQPKTPSRTFRIPDDPYYPAMAKARAEGTTLAALVNVWMYDYVHPDDDQTKVG